MSGFVLIVLVIRGKLIMQAGLEELGLDVTQNTSVSVCV